MPWGVAAVVGSAAIGAYSSNQASKSASSSAAAGRQLEQDQYNQTRSDNLPALGARNDALMRLETLLGINGNTADGAFGSLGGPISVGDVTKDPGYQFGLNQGQTAISNQLSARGMRNSGAAIKAAGQFGNDYATTKYGDAFNREVANRNAMLNPLQSLAGLGQSGANSIAAASQNYANQGAALYGQAGDAAAQNALAQGSIWGNAANQLGGWYANRQGGYNPYNTPGYGAGYNGTAVNQGPSGGDVNGSYWGIE